MKKYKNIVLVPTIALLLVVNNIPQNTNEAEILVEPFAIIEQDDHITNDGERLSDLYYIIQDEISYINELK